MRIWVALAALAMVGTACRGRAPEPTGGAAPSPEARGGTRPEPAASSSPAPVTAASGDLEDALSDVEEPRESTEKLAIPPELSLYPDRKRFLAIQIADAEEE